NSRTTWSSCTSHRRLTGSRASFLLQSRCLPIYKSGYLQRDRKFPFVYSIIATCVP
ncbi:hypothetical protein JG688_00017305, partial [Phytophthora aleatoria]